MRTGAPDQQSFLVHLCTVHLVNMEGLVWQTTARSRRSEPAAGRLIRQLGRMAPRALQRIRTSRVCPNDPLIHLGHEVRRVMTRATVERLDVADVTLVVTLLPPLTVCTGRARLPQGVKQSTGAGHRMRWGLLSWKWALLGVLLVAKLLHQGPELRLVSLESSCTRPLVG